MTEKKPEKCSSGCKCNSDAVEHLKQIAAKDFVTVQNLEPNAVPTSELSVATAKELEIPDSEGVEKLFENN
jgi:hypothetical protein